MSTSEILAQLPRLSPEDRDAIRAELDALDANAPIDRDEKRLIDQRVAAYRQNPDSVRSWAAAEAEIRQQLRL